LDFLWKRKYFISKRFCFPPPPPQISIKYTKKGFISSVNYLIESDERQGTGLRFCQTWLSRKQRSQRFSGNMAVRIPLSLCLQIFESNWVPQDGLFSKCFNGHKWSAVACALAQSLMANEMFWKSHLQHQLVTETSYTPDNKNWCEMEGLSMKFLKWW
jgi:hypothetical protein